MSQHPSDITRPRAPMPRRAAHVDAAPVQEVTAENWPRRIQEVLDLRSVPAKQRAQVLEIAKAIQEFLSPTPISAWQSADLDHFFRAQVPSLDSQSRREYAIAFALITESLSIQAPQKPSISPVNPAPSPHTDALELDLLSAPPSEPPSSADTWRGQQSPLQAERATQNQQDAPIIITASNPSIPAFSSRPALIPAPAPTPEAAAAAVPPEHPLVHPPEDDHLPAKPITFPDHWTTLRRIKVTPNKHHLLVDDRYTLHTPLPDPSDFQTHTQRACANISPFLAVRLAFPSLTVSAAASVVVVAVLAPFAHTLLLVLCALACIGLVGAWLKAFSTVKHWTQAHCKAPDPEEAARQYIALLRLGLYSHARDLLAFPLNTPPIALSQLMNPDRPPLGPAFNTLGPMALRDFARPRLALFDDPEWPETSRPRKRKWDPSSVHLETLASRKDGDAAILAIHGHTRHSYALLPMIRSADHGWQIADGELVLRTADLEAIQRLAYQHRQNLIDNEQFARACSQLNLTRLEVNRALLQHIISEHQANQIFAHLPPA